MAYFLDPLNLPRLRRLHPYPQQLNCTMSLARGFTRGVWHAGCSYQDDRSDEQWVSGTKHHKNSRRVRRLRSKSSPVASQSTAPAFRRLPRPAPPPSTTARFRATPAAGCFGLSALAKSRPIIELSSVCSENSHGRCSCPVCDLIAGLALNTLLTPPPLTG